MADNAGNDVIAIAADGMSAGIALHGAELHYLRDGDGRDLLWDGDPAFWTGRAPVLFPIVGGLRNNQYRYKARTYTLEKHGFARRSRFTLAEQSESAATFRLEADDATRAAYPFVFRLDMRFAIAGGAIDMTATVTNLGEAEMPASFGFHPALRWPLPYGERRADHRILFAQAEPAPIRRLDPAGLLASDPRPAPVRDRVLHLDDSLFVEDAVIFDHPVSRRVQYGAEAGPQVEVDFPDMPMLGIWTKPGAGYLCIEPWQGTSDPASFDGDIRDKPGIVLIAPGVSRQFAMRISLKNY